jgi:5-methylcytosine-specific restriction endonuclease McrA
VIKLRGAKCERCGRAGDLELHHKTYERLGNERFSDLELLCNPCHGEADRVREAKVQATRARARHNRALDTYASKKYGDEWQDRWDCDDLEEEFERWLERKEE